MPKEALAEIKNAEVLRLESVLRRKKFKLHAVFYEATMISEIDKPIQFEISIGNYGNKLDPNIPPSSSTTPACNPIFDGCSYYFIPWVDIKPCMQITSFWEDISYRLGAINKLIKLKNFIVSDVDVMLLKFDNFFVII